MFWKGEGGGVLQLVCGPTKTPVITVNLCARGCSMAANHPTNRPVIQIRRHNGGRDFKVCKGGQDCGVRLGSSRFPSPKSTRASAESKHQGLQRDSRLFGLLNVPKKTFPPQLNVQLGRVCTRTPHRGLCVRWTAPKTRFCHTDVLGV